MELLASIITILVGLIQLVVWLHDFLTKSYKPKHKKK